MIKCCYRIIAVWFNAVHQFKNILLQVRIGCCSTFSWHFKNMDYATGIAMTIKRDILAVALRVYVDNGNQVGQGVASGGKDEL